MVLQPDEPLLTHLDRRAAEHAAHGSPRAVEPGGEEVHGGDVHQQPPVFQVGLHGHPAQAEAQLQRPEEISLSGQHLPAQKPGPVAAGHRQLELRQSLSGQLPAHGSRQPQGPHLAVLPGGMVDIHLPPQPPVFLPQRGGVVPAAIPAGPAPAREQLSDPTHESHPHLLSACICLKYRAITVAAKYRIWSMAWSYSFSTASSLASASHR